MSVVQASTPSSILGIGNPLLDISAQTTTEFLEKYKVSLNNAILAAPEHVPMYEEMIKLFPVEYIAGGATQNSIRVAQWMLQKPGLTSYIGCVGKDRFGFELRKSAEADGVKVLYLEDEKEPTGTCACLIQNKERSLIANLAAANHYKPSHLQTPEVQAAIESSKIFYSAGFFLTVSPPALMEIAAQANKNNKIFAMNLAAPFICQFFSEPLLAAIPYADYVFGNETEAEAFAKQQGLTTTNMEEIALALAAFKKVNEHRPRIAVITQGSKSTIVATQGKTTVYDVPSIESDKIMDTNGAGDAFVGGFLAALAQQKPIEKCVEAGHYAARQIIQVSGTKLTGKPDFF